MEIITMVIGGIAMAIFFVSTFFKSKNLILSLQCVAHIILAVSEALTHVFSSIVQEAISLLRNLTVIKGINKLWLSISFVVVGTVAGILVNIFVDNNVWYGYLPIFANFEYAFFVLRKKTSVTQLKLSLALSSYLWATFFFLTKNYLAAGFNTLSATMALVLAISYIVRGFKEKKNVEKEEPEESVEA
jgi:hypothetical protein